MSDSVKPVPRSVVRRRLLICVAASPALVFSDIAFSQTPKQPVVIGWLHFGSRDNNIAQLGAFKEGLAALGWKEGQHYLCEERWADSHRETLPALAEELAAKKPIVIVAAPSPAVAAAAKAAPSTPVVQGTGGDPVETGLVKSLARPDGMITGLSNVIGDLQQKFIELLLTAAPKVTRIGLLVDSNTASRGRNMENARRYAVGRSLDLRFGEFVKPEDIQLALASLAKQNVQALIVFASPMLSSEAQRIIKLGFAQRWPIVGPSPAVVSTEAGALISYGIDSRESFRRAAYYVDRISKGTKPGDLPIEQPTKFELVINMKTAKALGLKIPNSLLVQATRVIE